MGIKSLKTSHDTHAYSYKKIGHFYSTYFMHNPICKNPFFFAYANQILTLQQRKNATLQVIFTAMLHPASYFVFPDVITSTINFVAITKLDANASVSSISVISD